MTLARPRVLIADEYPDAAGSLADLLTLLGFEARAARTPGDALRLATVYPPDAIVMEIRWARTDGYALAGELRRAAGGRPALVAVVGAHGQETQSRAAGFDHCLLKPADPAGRPT
jgi:CheY-like chemotaxis protein